MSTDSPHAQPAARPVNVAPEAATRHTDPGLLGPLHPLRVAHAIQRSWVTVVLSLALSALAASYYLSTTPPIYCASALIEFSVRRPRILTQQAAVIDDQNASQSEEIFNTRLEKFRGSALLSNATDRLQKADLADLPTTPAAVSHLLSRGVHFTLLRRTRLVRIDFEHASPAIAAAACNAYADAAEFDAYDENRRASDAAVTWLEAQALAQRAELERTDIALLKLVADSQTDLLTSRRRMAENALLEFNRNLVEAEGLLTRERALLTALDALSLSPEEAGCLPSGIPHAQELQQVLEKWRASLVDLDALQSKYTPLHPEVIAQGKMTAILRTQAAAALGRTRATVAANVTLYWQQADSLKNRKTELIGLADELDRQIAESQTSLTTLTRTRDASDTAYRGVLARIEEARMAAEENTATVKVAERARLPAAPVRPRAARLMLLALLAGLGGGIALALVTDNLEDHISDPDEVERSSGIRVLGVIPHMAARNGNTVARACIEHRNGELAEAVMSLRALLDAPQYASRTRVLLIASSVPAEGKSTTAANLAAAWAQNGERTLLIDFDLRRPRLAGIFDVQTDAPGLVDFLRDGGGPAKLASLVRNTDCPNLSVLPSQSIHRLNVRLRLTSRHVSEVVGWARQNYERVVIDAPPVALVSDTLLLSAAVDGVLMTARPGVSRSRVIRQTGQRFREAGVDLLALVVSDFSMPFGRYYSYGAYGVYRQYAGYSSDQPKPRGRSSPSRT